MKLLDLFSGIGGFSLSASWAGIETIAFCEQDKFCQKILRKHWPGVPIFDDIKTLRGDDVGSVDIVSGGAPCQPASCAGKRKGKEDDRWLWDEAFRIVHEVKPTWCIFENVGGLLTLESGLVFNSLLSDLEDAGYETQAFIIPACAVNAPHRRDRVWILAHAKGEQRGDRQTGQVRKRELCTDQFKHGYEIWSDVSGGNLDVIKKANESRICGNDDGVSRRMARLKVLGNAIVPQVAFQLFSAIVHAESCFYTDNTDISDQNNIH